MIATGPRWVPGLACPCGAVRHAPGARYYVSVVEHEGGRALPALGPFLTHPEALARVDRVRDLVLARYNPDGRAHWYLYGTIALPYDSTVVGRLNAELGSAGEEETDGP